MEQPTEASPLPVDSPREAGPSGPPPAPEPKTSRAYVAVVALPTLAGLVASTTLLVDYLRPSPVFCDPGGGCDALRVTTYANHFGIPTPAFGLAGFLALGILALLPGARARTTHVLVATLASVVGIYLLSVQARLGTYCKFCVVADASAIVIACIAMVRALRELDAPRSRAFVVPAFATMGLAVLAPAGAGTLMKVKVPEPIAREIDQTPEGQVTVVDFVDFQCPFCRMTNEVFSPIVAAHKEKVRLVRKQVPLPMHSHAHDAARAACCAERLGKGDEVAEALFTTDDLSPEGCEKAAVAAGLDPSAYRACLADPKTEDQIRADTSAFHESHGRGLPTIWIDRQKLEGAQPKEALKKAMDHALADKT